MKSLLKKFTDFWPFWLFIALMAFAFWLIEQGLNPNSRLCNYQIYKQPDGKYEVWWSCKTSRLEGTFDNYSDAKAFQIKECNDLKRFMQQAPKGERKL